MNDEQQFDLESDVGFKLFMVAGMSGLKKDMLALLGNGQPGRITKIEKEHEDLQKEVVTLARRVYSLAAILGTLFTIAKIWAALKGAGII